MDQTEILDRLCQKGREWLIHPPALIVQQAVERNPWFTIEDIYFALHALSEWMYVDVLRDFLNSYSFFPPKNPGRVGLITAGNIPAAGFHDVLMILFSGVEARVHCSHLDPVLIPAFMQDVFPEDTKIVFSRDMQGIQGLIASGSNLTAMYLKAEYSHIPLLIRANRFSIAVLNGQESGEELSGMIPDILLYNGLGCRNISQILIPEEYNWEKIRTVFSGEYKLSAPYQRKLKWEQALEDWRGNRPDFNLPVVFKNKLRPEPAEAAVVHCIYYKNQDHLREIISDVQDQIQCIAGVDQPWKYGALQHPGISDFADRTDTLDWLFENISR